MIRKFITNLSKKPVRFVDAQLQRAAAWLRRYKFKIVAIFGMPLLLIGYHQYSVSVAVSHATAAVEGEAYGTFGVEVFTLATVLVGEAKGQPEEWPDMATAFFARVSDKRWANDVEHVAKEGCEIDAMCDRVPEYLTSDVGQQAIVFAREALRAYHAGEFRSTHQGHSWATPKAAEGHRYFEGLMVVAEGTGHQYFADKPIRPMPRPTCTKPAGSHAPCTSIRPKHRPAVSSTDHEQYRDEGIELAVLEALSSPTDEK